MATIKVNCKACGAEREITPKPNPVTNLEKVQIYFRCKACGAANLRNGTAKMILRHKKQPKKIINNPINDNDINNIKKEKTKNGNYTEETRTPSQENTGSGFGFF